MTVKLFTPLPLGPITLRHRVVLAPLTRMRASPDGNVPMALNAEYYAQRATPGGLLITEATPVSWQGHGHPNVPGIHTAGQVAGWRLVTEAVHAKRGVIYIQLWHTGRVSHSSYQKDGGRPVGPSAIAAQGMTIDAGWKPVPYEVPRALDSAEMPALVETWRQAAANAMRAGFDGVEIHGANGYLLEQFLQSRSNVRTDCYGGSIENRCRLHLEISEAVVREIGAERTGIRLSPWGIANDSGEADPLPLYTHLIRELAKLGLVYLHLIEPRASGTGKADIVREGQPSAAATFRPLWPNVLIDAGGFDRDGALEAVRDGRADAVAFGRYFISNPDLPRRIEIGAPFTPYKRPTFYGGGAVGYTDYPTLGQQAEAAAAAAAAGG
jgi:N-ethylmaleimide reductase